MGNSQRDNQGPNHPGRVPNEPKHPDAEHPHPRRMERIEQAEQASHQEALMRTPSERSTNDRHRNAEAISSAPTNQTQPLTPREEDEEERVRTEAWDDSHSASAPSRTPPDGAQRSNAAWGSEAAGDAVVDKRSPEEKQGGRGERR